jgi:GxxExxY protein
LGKPKQFYKADFLWYDKIIVEVKAVSRLIDDHRAQALHYLRATGLRLAILVNLCSRPELDHERIML